MDERDDRPYSSGEGVPRERVGTDEEGSQKAGPAEKAFRATTALVVFGIPLVAGAAALVGYGVQKLFKGFTRKGNS